LHLVAPWAAVVKMYPGGSLGTMYVKSLCTIRRTRCNRRDLRGNGSGTKHFPSSCRDVKLYVQSNKNDANACAPSSAFECPLPEVASGRLGSTVATGINLLSAEPCHWHLATLGQCRRVGQEAQMRHERTFDGRLPHTHSGYPLPPSCACFMRIRMQMEGETRISADRAGKMLLVSG
jgi:hypothetical protein